MIQNNQIYKLYFELTGGRTISDAVYAFNNLSLEKKDDLNFGSLGDDYFKIFGIPVFVDIIKEPYERFVSYEFLLKELKIVDEAKFTKLHKGTPYYFLAWTAFDIGDYEKAVFYLDLAIGEDIRRAREFGKSEKDSIDWGMERPGGYLLRLNPEKSGTAIRVTRMLTNYVSDRLNIFSAQFNTEINLQEFINKFVVYIIKEDLKNRSIITTFYSFIFEFYDRYEMLKIRCEDKSSIEPFLVHLFKGGLVFETIMKLVAQKNGFMIDQKKEKGKIKDIKDKKKQKPIRTLGNFLYSKKFKDKYFDFDILQEDMDELTQLTLGQPKYAFGVTYKLRNVAGHDLRREDVFKDPEVYRKLFEQEMAAVLYIINKEFL